MGNQPDPCIRAHVYGTQLRDLPFPIGLRARGPRFFSFFLLIRGASMGGYHSHNSSESDKRECPVLAVCARVGLLVPLPVPKRLKRYYGQKHLHFVTCRYYFSRRARRGGPLEWK